MMKRVPSKSVGLFFVIFVTTHLISITSGQRLSLDNFPNPVTEDGIALCGRDRASFMCDPHGFIHYQQLDEIDVLIMNASKSNLVWCPYSTIPGEDGEKDQIIKNDAKLPRDQYNGLQIGVAIISSFDKYDYHRSYSSSHDIAMKTKTYAQSIHTQWGIGLAQCNNALMIFVAIHDRHLYISTGSGIKKYIKDDYINNYLIPKKIKPLMKKAKYGDAVELIIKSIIDILQNSDDLDKSAIWNEYKLYTTENTIFGFGFDTIFIGAMIVFGIGFMAYKYHKEKDYRQCESHLAALYAAKQQKKFKQTDCPICLQSFNQREENGNIRVTKILVCGHKFCKSCLDAWFNSQSSTKCPICRHDRDDWTKAVGPEESEQTDVKRDEDEDKKPDDDTSTTDHNGSNGTQKTSTTDDFYQNENVQQQNDQNNNNTEFRQRSRRRNRRYGGMAMNDWLFQQELLFRMNRVRYHYPRYVSNDMVSRWSRSSYSGSYTSDNTFRRSNPNYRPPSSYTSSSGSGGSSRSSGFSFGGGSSRGGGGGGGGW